jgi:hypothetical protein
MLTPRQNLLKAFHHEEPERVPVIALSDGYNRPTGMPASFYEDVQTLASRHPTLLAHTTALSRYLGVDILDRTGGYTPIYPDMGYTFTEEGDFQKERWETPYGVITCQVKKVTYPACPGEPDLITLFPIEYPVKSLSDYRAFAYIFEKMEYHILQDDIARRIADVGEDGIVTAGAPSSPLGMCVRLYTGVAHLAYAWSDHRSQLHDLLEVIAENYLRACRGLAKTQADGVISYDDTTTLAISPSMFRELEAPYINRAADILHAAGKLYIHHACGHVAGLLKDFRSTRIDALDGPAAPPVGNTTVAMASEGLGDGITIMPFSEEYAVKNSDPAVTRAYIRSMFEQAVSRRNLVIDIVSPPAAPIETLQIAADEARRCAMNPI